MISETESPEHPIDDISEDGLDDIEYVSKSQLKRDSKALQDLGRKIAAYNEEQLATIPLEGKFKDAVMLARKLGNKRGAQKRHYQYMGKLLRNMDTDSIFAAVERIEQRDRLAHQQFHRLEQWRDRIIDRGEAAIDELCAQHPAVERQQLRQLWRNHQRAADNKKPAIARQIFRQLRDSLLQE